MELFTAFDRAVASTADVVKATPADQMSARTPCTEWDVSALVRHVIEGNAHCGQLLRGEDVDRTPVSGDLTGAWRDSVGVIRSAFREPGATTTFAMESRTVHATPTPSFSLVSQIRTTAAPSGTLQRRCTLSPAPQLWRGGSSVKPQSRSGPI